MFDQQTFYLQPGDKVSIHRDGKQVEISTTSFVRVQVCFDPYMDFIDSDKSFIPEFEPIKSE